MTRRHTATAPVAAGPTLRPHQIVDRLGLWAEAGRHGLSSAMREDRSARSTAFDLVHVGRTSVRVGDVLDLLAEQSALRPPRSGHVGNWEAILRGQAGVMDFNASICRGGHGYALVYGFNLTESADGESGDWVYAPGSVVRDRQATRLRLSTWNGRRWEAPQDGGPRFVPFVRTATDAGTVALGEWHMSATREAADFSVVLEAEAIWAQRATVRQALRTLVTAALGTSNPPRALGDLFGRYARPDGTVERSDLSADGGTLRLGGVDFGSVEELVDAALIPFAALAEPDRQQDLVRTAPGAVPVASTILTGVLSAIVSTHYPDGAPARDRTQPFNPHVHWGARHMAGFPPVQRGYAVERSTVKSYRWMLRALLEEHEQIDPVALVLLPAIVFALWPKAAAPLDVTAVGGLCQRVRELADESAADVAQAQVDDVVAAWIRAEGRAVSAGFLSRFAPRQGIAGDGDAPAGPDVEPEGFRALPFDRACMIVGALHRLQEVGAP